MMLKNFTMMFILEEPYFAGNQTFLNESNEIVTEPVYKMTS
jgi:hypothetical protein